MNEVIINVSGAPHKVDFPTSYTYQSLQIIAIISRSQSPTTSFSLANFVLSILALKPSIEGYT